jgi:uncharacterized protein (UPF0264 family)
LSSREEVLEMELLVSIIAVGEVAPAIAGGADIIDIKNPAEGSLGAATPSTIAEILGAVGSRRQTSCAIGDLPCLPGTASLAAAGAAALGPDYVKLGLLGPGDAEQALSVMRPATRAIRMVAPATKVIACAYGDWRMLDSVSPNDLPAVAKSAGADGVLVDTIRKDGRCLFDFLDRSTISSFIEDARGQDLISAIAGSLKAGHAPLIRQLEPDVVGIRGAACSNSDRAQGSIEAERVRQFKQALI